MFAWDYVTTENVVWLLLILGVAGIWSLVDKIKK